MKGISQDELEAVRPDQDAEGAVEFCLQQLYRDRAHGLTDCVAGVCTYEELIGALLLARDEIQDARSDYAATCGP